MNKNKKRLIILLAVTTCLSLVSCKKDSKNLDSSKNKSKQDVNINNIVNKDGNDIETRYNTPKGYKRVITKDNSFASFLRNEELKPYGEKSYYYNGREKKSDGVYDSVFNVDLEGKNLLHCADACYKFRGDYLYKQKKYSDIKFRFVSGGIADFEKYTRGYRVDPESGEYFLMGEPSADQNVYNKFMDTVYGYSGTLSLVKDTRPISFKDMEIGDMFVRGGTPGTKRVGHAVMIIDMATDKKGEKIFMLAQSYMPAQQPQVLINPLNKELSPWYKLKEVESSGKLKTPQWTFELNELRRFNE